MLISAKYKTAGVIFACLLLLTAIAETVRASELKSYFARLGETKIHYQSAGKGDNALVFVHGWTCNSDFWRGQLNAFSNARVIAIDLPGHGKSGKPRVDYTIDYFARSVAAVLKEAKIRRAVLVGHSMGTPVIRQVYRLFPEKVAGLVVVDGSLRMLFSKEQMDQFMGGLRTNYAVAAPQMIDGMLQPVRDEKLRAEIRTVMLSAPDYVAISAMEGMADPKLYQTDAINVPVLAVLAKSPFWAADTEQFLRQLAPQLEFVVWDDVSHFLMMEKPQEFNQTLRDFLSKHKLG